MNTKLEKLKENINNNTKETINLINTKLEKNFKDLKNIELIENSQIFNGDRKSTRLNSSHRLESRMPSSA